MRHAPASRSVLGFANRPPADVRVKVRYGALRDQFDIFREPRSGLSVFSYAVNDRTRFFKLTSELEVVPMSLLAQQVDVLDASQAAQASLAAQCSAADLASDAHQWHWSHRRM